MRPSFRLEAEMPYCGDMATSFRRSFHPTLIILILCLRVPSLAQPGSPTVLLVSFDGMRFDYIDKHDLKNFKAFRAAGTAAEAIIPCYPSLTFPNHYSIVTGMRPGHHGLVDNNFYDSATSVTYSIRNRDAGADIRYYGGTPLWTLARLAGLKSASFFWVGSELSEPSARPDKFVKYDEKIPFRTRVDSVLAWLRLDAAERPRFITLYFWEPDHTSHDTGIESAETRAALLKMDSVLGYLMQGLAATSLPINTILVSDHGMSELTMADDTFVFLDELYDVKASRIRTVPSSTLAHLYINSRSATDSLYTLLKQKEKYFKVYKNTNLPADWHYNHYRVGDIIIVAEPLHNIRLGNRQAFFQQAKQGSKFGVHGYDPAVVTDMRGIFMAQGPQIKKGVKLGLVRNIDIYPFLARILKLKLPEIDGDPRALQSLYNGK